MHMQSSTVDDHHLQSQVSCVILVVSKTFTLLMHDTRAASGTEAPVMTPDGVDFSFFHDTSDCKPEFDMQLKAKQTKTAGSLGMDCRCANPRGMLLGVNGWLAG